MLDEFLSLEEFLEMSHLPGTHNEENGRLSQRPPQDTLVGAFARLTEPFFAYLKAAIIITVNADFEIRDNTSHASIPMDTDKSSSVAENLQEYSTAE